MNDTTDRDPRLVAIPDTHGHAKGEHKPYAEERPLPLTARMLFLWFYHACRRGSPRFLMVADHMNYLTFEDPAAVNLVRRALKLAGAGDLHGAAETANVEVGHAAVVSEGLRRGMRYSIGAEVDNDPRSRPDAQNIVDAMRPDAIIRSVHFVPITHPVHGENWNWPFDNPEFADLFDVVGTDALWESYVAILVDAIERLPGHIIGHFYVPAVFGHWPEDAKLSAYEDRVLDAAAARGMAIEFNTRFLYRDHPDEEKDKYMTANRRLLRKAKQRGVMIAVGSDAHSPRDQGNAFDIVLGVLDELEINELVFPLAGSLRRVALRVVREPEPEPPPPPPPVPEPVAAKPARGAADRGGSKRPKTAASANGSTAHASSGGTRAGAGGSSTPSRKKSPAKPAVAAVVDDTVAAIADVVKAVLVKPASAGDGPSKSAPKSRVPKPAAPAKARASASPKPALEAAAAKPAPSTPAKSAAKTAAVPTAPASSTATPKAVAKSAPVASGARTAPEKADGTSAGRGASVSVAKPVAKLPVAKTPIAKTPAKSPARKAEPVKAASVKAAPVKAAPVKPAVAKPTVVKPTVAKPAAKKAAPTKAVAKKAPPAKAPAKKAATGKAAVKKSAPVQPAAKKTSTAKKSANAKTAPPAAKRPPARVKPGAKKAAPAKKFAPARPAAKKPLRPAPARSTSRAKPVAKKSAKKSPSKRR